MKIWNSPRHKDDYINDIRTTMAKEKGSATITGVMMWAIGLFATAALAAAGMSANTNTHQDDKISSQGERIAAIEVKTERMPILEGKVDRLLEAQRINPSDVERDVVAQLDKASTTKP